MTNKDLSIIIVDDLQFSRIVVKTALKKAGYNGVRMADSATEALAMIKQKHADVILADWMMPEMDGLELTQLIGNATKRMAAILPSSCLLHTMVSNTWLKPSTMVSTTIYVNRQTLRNLPRV